MGTFCTTGRRKEEITMCPVYRKLYKPEDKKFQEHVHVRPLYRGILAMDSTLNHLHTILKDRKTPLLINEEAQQQHG